MDNALLDLIDDVGVVGQYLPVVEVVGDRDERLAALEALAIRPTAKARP